MSSTDSCLTSARDRARVYEMIETVQDIKQEDNVAPEPELRNLLAGVNPEALTILADNDICSVDDAKMLTATDHLQLGIKLGSRNKILKRLVPKDIVAPEPKEPEGKPEGRPGSRSMEEYRAMGYTTTRPPSDNLLDFIKKYADKEDKHPGCVAECIEICQINAMQDLDDLRMLSRRCWLGDYFPAKVALRFENALESPEMLYFFNKLDEDNKKPWAGTFHFTYKIESMESACATYGILSALLLTMNVGSFGAIDISDWSSFESGVGMQRCNGTSLLRWTSGRPGETVEECVSALSAESEKWFVVANFGASLFLIMTLLLSSWLYIAFGIPGADRTRPDEVQAVVARFSGEFATLNFLFLFSVALSGTGILQLTQIKSKRAARPCR